MNAFRQAFFAHTLEFSPLVQGIRFLDFPASAPNLALFSGL